MSYHLKRVHSLSVSNDSESTTLPTIMTMWKQKQTVNVAELLEILFAGLCLQDSLLLSLIVAPFQRDILGLDLPFTSRKTLRLTINAEIEAYDILPGYGY
ncbi:hypothetical protein V1527DRAFT_474214, partial [Lipomyces starkeyi]